MVTSSKNSPLLVKITMPAIKLHFRLVPIIRAAVLAVSLYAGLPAVAEDHFQAFTADSFAEIKAHFNGKEFLLGLWSVDCPPCLVELDMMGKLLKKNPDLPFVLVSTDPIDQREFAVDFLEEFDLDGIESWMFADSFSERLRYTIDPNWFGELPRSYGQHHRHSHSGIMTRELLNEWFSRPLN